VRPSVTRMGLPPFSVPDNERAARSPMGRIQIVVLPSLCAEYATYCPSRYRWSARGSRDGNSNRI
jgi:hypothetical protein